MKQYSRTCLADRMCVLIIRCQSSKLSLKLHITFYPPAVDPVDQDMAIFGLHLRSLALIAIYSVYVYLWTCQVIMRGT